MDFDIKSSKPPLDVAPARPKLQLRKRAVAALSLLMLRVVALFAFGVAYGVIVTHLHNSKQFSPATLDIDRSNPWYLLQWGFAGVVLGSLLPWLDGEDATEGASGHPTKTDWEPAVRSIGAFVGIAYAIV